MHHKGKNKSKKEKEKKRGKKNLLQGDSNEHPQNTFQLKINASIHWTYEQEVWRSPSEYLNWA